VLWKAKKEPTCEIDPLLGQCPPDINQTKGAYIMKEKIDKLVSEICKHEGKQKEVSAGNIREVLAMVSDECHKSLPTRELIADWGAQRAKEKLAKS